MSIKQQVSTVREGVRRLDKYVKCLDALQNILEVSKSFGCYSSLPDEFTFLQKQSIETIYHDIQEMRIEAEEMALYLAEKAEDMEKGGEKCETTLQN